MWLFLTITTESTSDPALVPSIQSNWWLAKSQLKRTMERLMLERCWTPDPHCVICVRTSCVITEVQSEFQNKWRSWSIAQFLISSVHLPVRKFNISAFIVTQVTCDLPTHPVTTKQSWKHLENLKLVDPEYDKPGRINVLLGVEVFLELIARAGSMVLTTHPQPLIVSLDGYWLET